MANSTDPCSSGMSRAWMALTDSRPIPGMPKTASVITAPDSRPATWIAMIVTTGIRAFFSA